MRALFLLLPFVLCYAPTIANASKLDNGVSSLATTLQQSLISCTLQIHCPTCHLCSGHGECVPVPTDTDPNMDCGVFCGNTMLCDSRQHCALMSLPLCDCDWEKGICKDIPLSQQQHQQNQNIIGRETVEEALQNGEEQNWNNEARRRGPDFQLQAPHVALVVICCIICLCITVAVCISKRGEETRNETPQKIVM